MAKPKRQPKRRKDEDELKGDVVRMRVTAEQKKALVDAAAKEGLELSQWLRRLALREAGRLPSAN
jgi:hypothetical protein